MRNCRRFHFISGEIPQADLDSERATVFSDWLGWSGSTRTQRKRHRRRGGQDRENHSEYNQRLKVIPSCPHSSTRPWDTWASWGGTSLPTWSCQSSSSSSSSCKQQRFNRRWLTKQIGPVVAEMLLLSRESTQPSHYGHELWTRTERTEVANTEGPKWVSSTDRYFGYRIFLTDRDETYGKIWASRF